MNDIRPQPRRDLPEIPVIGLGADGMVGLAVREHARLDTMLRAARRQFTPAFIALADRVSHRWLVRTRNPYLAEMEAVAARLRKSGIFALNISYEWACTGAVGPDPAGGGSRLVHTLDWVQHQMGRHVVVAVDGGPAGTWLNMTWPGFAGVVGALAPGRFAAAINQPPMPRRLGLAPVDWVIERVGAWRANALPAAHLLRQVFETCPGYAEARDRLGSGPIVTPAIFLLTGVEPHEATVIERPNGAAVFHDGLVAVANHWLTRGLGAGSRGIDSEGRQRLMGDYLSRPAGDLAWLKPPIVNWYTRLACVANAATGELVVQGFEADGPATAVLRLAATR